MIALYFTGVILLLLFLFHMSKGSGDFSLSTGFRDSDVSTVTDSSELTKTKFTWVDWVLDNIEHL